MATCSTSKTWFCLMGVPMCVSNLMRPGIYKICGFTRVHAAFFVTGNIRDVDRCTEKPFKISAGTTTFYIQAYLNVGSEAIFSRNRTGKFQKSECYRCIRGHMELFT